MKHLYKFSLFLGFLILGIYSFGQNDNAATNGYIPDSQDFSDNTPVLILSAASAATALPSEVNNTDEIFFPRKSFNGNKYFYSQDQTASCVSVAFAFYTFSYEINRVRNLSGQPDDNKYPPNFVWNFLNDGYDSVGSNFSSVLGIMEENGVANGVDWGNFDPHDTLRWMSGYEKYHNSHFNRIEGHSIIYDLYDTTNLMLLKHWISNHNEGDTAKGGLAVFGSGGSCATPVNLPDSSAYPGEWAIVDWANGCRHAWTIVGYCDDVKFDWGGAGSAGNIQPDGQFRNDIDNNFDGQINVKDWEIGAFNVAGKGDETAVNDGLVWIPYKTVAEMDNQWGCEVYVIHVDDDYEPELEVKVKVNHDCRNNYGARYSWAENANQIIPSPGCHAYIDNIFYFNGGEHTLHGIDSNSVETGFDISYWIEEEDFGKIFFRPYETGPVYYNGIVEYMSIIDYRWDEEFELFSDATNVPIPHATSPTNTIFVNYDLIPHESYITSNLTFNSDMVSRFNPTVSNATLTIDDGVAIDMYESELEILSTSSLVIDDNVTFTAKDGYCKITVDGTITIGDNVSFIAEDGASLRLVLNNTGLTLSITGGTWDGAAIISYIDDLTISNSKFIDGAIYGYNGDYDINLTDFNNSFVVISDASGNSNSVNISNQCTFTDYASLMYAVNIDDYPDFTIDNCKFEDNSKGIYIINSGDGRSGGYITDCEITGSAYVAIQVYNSDVEIVDNEISDNRYGVKSYNNSNIKLQGTDHDTPSQTIADNIYYEVYASSGSFPYYFHWNAIIDNDNPQPMVYLSGSSGFSIEDVRYNYWGTGFNYLTDLYPSGGYIWSPVWEPYGKSVSVAESLYESALEKIKLEDYSGAKIDLKEIVSENQTSIYAQAALKKLFAIEKFDQNDYVALKTYLENETAIQQEDELIKTADFLINFCEIKLENWQTAINWFENVIQDPDQMEDSIFAVIDLGYTYLWMQNGGTKSACVGTMTEYIPSSKEQFEEKRDYLLSLIPGDQLSEQMVNDIGLLKMGELLQNVPNPFSGSTQIWYKLEDESSVTVDVFDYSGKKIRSFSQGTMDKGPHFFEFHSEGLPAGIYFYKLEINGKVSDSKKMTIMR